MIPKISKILYATDLSDNSAYAFRYAISSAIQHDADIVILHVIEALPKSARAMVESQVGGDLRGKILTDAVKHATERIQKRLQLFCEMELKDNPECSDRISRIEVCEGHPAEEILNKADELDCDVIIMGTHGKGSISHAFLGSMAKRVLRNIRKPVFIIPLPVGEIDITIHDI